MKSPRLLALLALALAMTPLGCSKPASNTSVTQESAQNDPTESEYKDAVDAVRPLAEAGDPEAQSALGIFYVNGRGVEKDFVEAYKWLKLASDQGDKDAGTAFAVIDKLMTSQEIAEAKSRANSFRPKKAATSTAIAKP
ncbi:MAG TPA: SEL1-like repeat protein [Candidatus Saccharimonadales bacterium]|nr:SEL1-like repeat protein [Candidatus Saccharimonadales bacterium]